MKEAGSYVYLDLMLIVQYQKSFDYPSSVVQGVKTPSFKN
jgi:hypothetical protein